MREEERVRMGSKRIGEEGEERQSEREENTSRVDILLAFCES